MNKRIIYFNIIDNNYYDGNGILFGNRDFFTYLENKDTIELHYVTDVTGSDPSTWTKWTGLSTLPTIASSVAVDDSIQHAFKGVLLNELSGTVTSIQVQVTETVYLNPQGILQVFDALDVAKSFSYTSFSKVDTVLTFVTNEILDEGVIYPVNSEVRLSEALCIKATENDVDNTYASQGIFTFTLYALSYKILELLDYTNTAQIDGILEHKILSNGNTIYTYSIPYIIRNLRDFDNEAQVPTQEADSIASKTWVLSIVGSRPPIPSGGSTNQVLAKASDADYDFEWKSVNVPSATSQLVNDLDFVTASDVHNIPTGGSVGQVLAKISGDDYDANWINVSGGSFLQVNADWNAVSGAAEILNKPTIPAAQIQSDWNQTATGSSDFIKNKPSIPVNSDFTLNGLSEKSYNNLTDKPTIPSGTSQLENDSGFVTSNDIPSATSQLINDSNFLSVGQIYGIPSGGSTGQVLSKVNATDYNVAWTTPVTGGSVSQIQSDWNQTNDVEVDYIKNKPTIPTNSSFTLAGLSEKSYASLTDKPTIPTKTSDLTNDSDFTTASAVSSGYVAKDGSKVLSDNNYDSASKTKLDNLANITTIGANLSLDSGTLSVNVSSGGTSITWHIIDTNTTASANHGYMIDASSGAIELTLPSSFTLGDTIPVRVLDKTNTITLKRNGNKIEGLDEDLTVDIDKSGFYLTASDATHGWIVTTEIPGGSDSKIFATCNGRLTLTTNVPVTTADVTSATTIYFTPYNGSQIALYDGASWGIYVFSELSLSLSGLTANTNYDVFIYNNSGTLTLESVAWTDGTTRATALVMQDGIFVKSGDLSKRYLGTIRTTATTGQCEDSRLKRFVWNYYNQASFRGWTYNTNASWTYATGAWREFNNGTGQNRFQMVCGYITSALVYNGSDVTGATGSSAYLGVAMDSTTSPFLTKKFIGTTGLMNEWGVPFIQLSAGYHYFTMVEYSQSGTAYTNNGDEQSFVSIQA